MTPFSGSFVDSAAGRVLRLHRNAAGMSQSDLGAAAGISFQQIQKYETGVNRLSISRLFELCGVLGVETSEFMNEVQDMLAPEDAAAQRRSVERLQFLASEEGQRAISAMMALDDPLLLESLANLLVSVESTKTERQPQ